MKFNWPSRYYGTQQKNEITKSPTACGVCLALNVDNRAREKKN